MPWAQNLYLLTNRNKILPRRFFHRIDHIWYSRGASTLGVVEFWRYFDNNPDRINPSTIRNRPLSPTKSRRPWTQLVTAGVNFKSRPHLNLHAISCCQISMDKFFLSQIFHAESHMIAKPNQMKNSKNLQRYDDRKQKSQEAACMRWLLLVRKAKLETKNIKINS